jgi:hypothetical protein
MSGALITARLTPGAILSISRMSNIYNLLS